MHSRLRVAIRFVPVWTGFILLLIKVNWRFFPSLTDSGGTEELFSKALTEFTHWYDANRSARHEKRGLFKLSPNVSRFESLSLLKLSGNVDKRFVKTTGPSRTRESISDSGVMTSQTNQNKLSVSRTNSAISATFHTDDGFKYIPTTVVEPTDFSSVVKRRHQPQTYGTVSRPFHQNHGNKQQPAGTKSSITKTQMVQKAATHAGKALTDGVFWTSEVEHWIPKGLPLSEVMELMAKARTQKVESLEAGSTVRCGRPPNAFVRMSNGDAFCAKYRPSDNYSVLGELMSFHLSRLLGMDNVPPVLLSYVNMRSSPWADVMDLMPALHWSSDIANTLVPSLIVQALNSGIPLDSRVLRRKLNCTCVDVKRGVCLCDSDTEKALARLAQWGSMVIFDYLTANYDRTAASVSDLTSSVRNLGQTSEGKLWLLDNEAAFFHSYQLIQRGSATGTRLQHVHLRHLQSTCIFQQDFVRQFTDLWATGDPAKRLMDYIRMREPLFEHVAVDSADYRVFVEVFSRRVAEVTHWINHCRSLNK